MHVMEWGVWCGVVCAVLCCVVPCRVVPCRALPWSSDRRFWRMTPSPVYNSTGGKTTWEKALTPHHTIHHIALHPTPLHALQRTTGRLPKSIIHKLTQVLEHHGQTANALMRARHYQGRA